MSSPARMQRTACRGDRPAPAPQAGRDGGTGRRAGAGQAHAAGHRARRQGNLRRALTYGAGPWETVDWDLFDLVSVDAYRDAACRGGTGWMIVDEKSDPPVIPGTYERDEEEQVRHLHDLLAAYGADGIDSAFWHILAGFEAPRHHSDPHRELDLASYGAVAVLDHESGTTYPDMTWEPKKVFGAIAAACARARP
jgi:hypothetical protein